MRTSKPSSSIQDHLEQKRALLLRRLSIITLGLVILYLFIGLALEVPVKAYIFIPFIISSIVTYFLSKWGRDSLAKITGLLSYDAMIFLVASSEPFETGVHFYFVSVGAVAIVLFGYEEWRKAALLVSVAVLLYMLVFLTDFSLLPMREFQPDQARIFFVIHLVTSSFVSTYSLLYFLRLYAVTDRDLRTKEMLLLEKNIELQKINLELDRFIYSASHDLRAPLSSISGLIGLIRKEVDATTKEEYLTMIEGRVTHLQAFIRDIISFSRNVRTDVTREPVHLHSLVNGVIELLKYIPAALSIEFRNEVPDDFQLITDRPRINLIVFNLISNAIQYSDHQKDKPYIRISSQVTNSLVQLCVEDNGIGIEEAHQARVFDMFYRASEQSKGSGLGLYMVKEAMEKLGGRVFMHSTPSEGTTISLEWNTSLA